jgi:hypothetical protein
MDVVALGCQLSSGALSGVAEEAAAGVDEVMVGL